MDETEWFVCAEPNRMMRHLRPKAHARYDPRSWFSGGHKGYQLPRRWRLFLAAYCRRIYPRLTNAIARRLVEFGEQFADTPPGDRRADGIFDEFRDAPRSGEAIGVLRGLSWPLASAAGELRRVAGEAVRKATAERAARQTALRGAMDAEAQAQCDLIRDLFGNPSRQVPLDRAWLAWGRGLVPDLAKSAYQKSNAPSGTLDLARLCVLADALEESGCTCEDILSHLRSPGPHVRGCWALDLILGKG